MDLEVLTLLSPDVTLDEAFHRFRKGTRAVVVDAPHGRYLLTASDLSQAWNDLADSGQDAAGVPVGQVPPRHRYTATPRMPPRRIMSDVPQSFSMQESHTFAQAFQSQEPEYTIQDAAGGTVVVVTSSKTLGGGLRSVGTSGTVICTCIGNPVHRCEQSALVTPGVCNKPHRVKVNCVAVDDP